MSAEGSPSIRIGAVAPSDAVSSFVSFRAILATNPAPIGISAACALCPITRSQISAATAVRMMVLRPLSFAHSPDSRVISFSLSKRIAADTAAASAVTRHSAAITLLISPHITQNSMHTPVPPLRCVPVLTLFHDPLLAFHPPRGFYHFLHTAVISIASRSPFTSSSCACRRPSSNGSHSVRASASTLRAMSVSCWVAVF